VLRAITILLVIFSSLEVHAASLTKHDINVHLHPSSGAIELSDKITVQQKSEFRFRLASWLKMTKVLLNGKSVIPHRTPQGWWLVLPDSGIHTLHFDIKGTIPPLPDHPIQGMTGDARAGKDGVFLPGYAAWVPDTMTAQSPTGCGRECQSLIRSPGQVDQVIKKHLHLTEPWNYPLSSSGPMRLRNGAAAIFDSELIFIRA